MSKIFKVKFKPKKKEGKTIEELFDSIELYRSEGKSVLAIYNAFVASNLWVKSHSTFARAYYKHRRSISPTSIASRVKSLRKEGSISQLFDDVDADTLEAEEAAADVVETEETDADIAETEKANDVSLIRKDLTLEEKRSIAADIFKQRLN